MKFNTEFKNHLTLISSTMSPLLKTHF